MKKKSKRIWSMVLALAVLLTMMPTAAFAVEQDAPAAEKEPSLEDTLPQETLLEDQPHALRVTEVAHAVEGGNIYFDTSTGAITDCDASVTSAVIPAVINDTAVTSIGYQAFFRCESLSSVSIPDSVTSIGSSAFQYCFSLTSVIISGQVNSIGDSAFSGCNALDSVTIGNGVKSIGGFAFEHCDNLSSIVIPSSVTSIGNSAFYNCPSLNNIVIPSSVIELGNAVFSNCISLTSAGPIGGNYNIEFGWTEAIPDNAFHSCANLTNVVIPNTTSSIGEYAFSNCSGLNSISIPDNVTIISDYAFQDCSSLTRIDIPVSVEKIGRAAFSGCAKLKKITMPNSVTEINDNAFVGCDSLTSAGPIGGGYDYEFDWQTMIPDYAFAHCSKLDAVMLPDTIESIGEDAFHGCKSLTELDIPDSVNTIGEKAFYDCEGLSKIILPKTVTQIGSSAFYGCSKLISAGPIGGGYNCEFGWTESIPDSAFCECSNFKSITLPDGLKEIGESAFHACDGLTSIDIPDNVTSIGSFAFSNCENLRQISIPNVSWIGLGAFEDCDKLLNAVVNGVINKYAFEDCDALTDVVIMEGATSIYSMAFYGCQALKNISIPSSLRLIDSNAFQYCGITNIYYAGDEAQWERISIKGYNQPISTATIHYNSTGPDDPGSGETDSSIICMINTLTGYDENTKQVTFGGDPTPYTYQITDETVLSEDINKLFGKTVLVRYKSGEYGTPDMLTYYVLSISPASVASGTLKNVTQSTVSIGDKEYPLDIQNSSASLDTLQNNLGNFAVCYFYNDAVVDVKFPKKQTGIFNTGTQSSITIDNKKYLAAFANPAPYLSAIDLWFNQTVEYWIVDDIIYDIQLLDYETTIYKRLEKIQDNKAYFHDGSNYQIVDSSSIDDSLVGHWVVATLTTSADGGTMLSDMRLFQPQISVEIEMVDDRNVRLKDNEYSYDGSDYVPSSKFEIGYEITIKSKVSGISDIDLVAMREDPSMTVTLENLEINPPDGFNSGWTGSGEIPDVPGTTVLPGQTKVGKGFVRPGMWYFVDKEDVSVTETIQMKLETSIGEYEEEVSFTIMNLNYEPPKTKEEALNSSETKSLINEAADELDELDIDSGIMITDPSLVKLDFGIDDNSLTRLKKELLTEVLMSSAPEDSLSDQIADDLMSKVFGEYKSPISGSKYTVPLRYVFETPDYGMLTVQFTCNINSFTLNSSKYALYATVDYEVLQQDKDSGDKTWPSYKKGDFAQIAFADVKAYTDAAYDVAKQAIKDAYDDVWGKQANQIADFLFDDVVKAILKASKTSFSDAMWKIMTWPTENMSVACPVDIFIYDANGNLCGSIKNNQVTKTSAEFGLSVSGDVKYVTGLRDDYKVLYKATDNGSMDIAITEYTGYESPLRAVTFKAVPLAQDGTYTQNIAGEVLAEVNSYKLISNTEEGDIIPDDKVVLISWTSDENDQEETPTPTPEPGGNSGGSGGSSSCTNRYTISVVDGIDNGFIGVNPSQAEPGDIVTITIDPDAGYELDALIVTDSSGNQIAIEKETDTRYTFKMPRGRVSIDATFIAIEDESASQTSGEPFTDVSSRDWFYDAVEYVYENGMMQGTSSSLFEPNGVTTRAMVVTILHRCEGETRTYKSDFTDVASNMYYADAVAWAQANGIVNGTSATTFSPNDPITREQMATILYRYADFKDYDMTIGGMSLHKYTDADQISAFANDAMRWANENELITGDTAMSLNPQDNATRAEVAMILMRFCKSMAE